MDRSPSEELEHYEEIDEHEHTTHRSPWLRAMMMGALDGLLSVASVMLGVGGGTGDLASMRLAGLAAWIAGALSMFLGEDVWWRNPRKMHCPMEPLLFWTIIPCPSSQLTHQTLISWHLLGEYASVAAQRDCEAADIKKEMDMQVLKVL
jgi:hypothetical protein